MISPCKSKIKTGFYKLHVTSTGALITASLFPLVLYIPITYKYIKHYTYISRIRRRPTLHSGVVSSSHKTTKPFSIKVAFLFYFAPPTIDGCRCTHIYILVSLQYTTCSICRACVRDGRQPPGILLNFFLLLNP
jgi:hypothetical protein